MRRRPRADGDVRGEPDDRNLRARRALGDYLVAYWAFILGALLVVGGIAAIVLGYLGVSGTIYVGLQLPYVVSGGLLGLGLIVAGSALVLLHAIDRQAHLLRRLTAQLANVDGDRPDDGRVVVPTGARTFHRATCLLVEGKTTERLTPAAARSRRLRPCRLCEPLAARP